MNQLRENLNRVEDTLNQNFKNSYLFNYDARVLVDFVALSDTSFKIVFNVISLLAVAAYNDETKMEQNKTKKR